MKCLLLLLLLGSVPGETDLARAGKPKTVSFTMKYTVETGGKTGHLTLTSIVPMNRPGRQEVVALTCSPEASEIFEKDGDRFARFEVADPGSRFEITIRVKMKLQLVDFQTARKQRKKNRKKIKAAAAEETLKKHLLPEKFIETKDPRILALARKARARGEARKVRKIHDLVLKRFGPASYRGEDRGAAASVESKKVDCRDYADIFVALCRASGLPARYVEGFTIPYSGGPEYAWTEVFLAKYGWVTFDPMLVEFGSASFEALRNEYVLLTRHRCSTVLKGEHYYHTEYGGESMRVALDVHVP